MDQTMTPVYCCPLCGFDAPHSVLGELHEVYAIRCTNCANGSLVRGEELARHQMRWEAELQEILRTLEHSGDS